MSVREGAAVDIQVPAEFEAALEQRTRELNEAHAREAATAHVLKVISRFDVRPPGGARDPG